MALPAIDLNDLSPEDKLRPLEQVWDSLAKRPAEVPLAQWQVHELDRRLDDINSDRATGIPWDRVLREIEGRAR
jgi:putative addiction module component (TIGR02574 family)